MRWAIKYIQELPFHMGSKKTQRGYECWWSPQTGPAKEANSVVAFVDINAAYLARLPSSIDLGGRSDYYYCVEEVPT